MKYLLNVDCLELVLQQSDAKELKGNEEFCFSNTFKPHHNNGYEKCNKIEYKNQAFATLSYCPSLRNRSRNRDIFVLKIANECFYREDSIKKEVLHFLSSYRFHIKSIRELHIAIDGNGIIKKHDKLFNKKELIRQRTIKLSQTLDDATKEIVGIRLGSNNSEKIVAIYNKSREILKSNKNYIGQFWHENGLDEVNGNIDRLELRMKSKELIGMENKLLKLEDIDFLAAIVKEKTKSHLTFVNTITKKKFEVIDWSEFEAIEVRKVPLIININSEQSIRTTLKTLYLKGFQFKEKKFHECALILSKHYDLTRWYYTSQDKWIKRNPIIKKNNISVYSD